MPTDLSYISSELSNLLKRDLNLYSNIIGNVALLYPTDKVMILTEVNDTNRTEVKKFLSKSKDRVVIFPEIPTNLEDFIEFFKLKRQYPTQVLSLGGKIGVYARKYLDSSLRNEDISDYLIEKYNISPEILNLVLENGNLSESISSLPMAILLNRKEKADSAPIRSLIIPGGIPVNTEKERPYSISEIAGSKDLDGIIFQLAFNRILSEGAPNLYAETEKQRQELENKGYIVNRLDSRIHFCLPKIVKSFVENENLDTVIAKTPILSTVGQYYVNRDANYIVFNSFKKSQCGPAGFSTVVLVDLRKPKNAGRYSLEFIIDVDRKSKQNSYNTDLKHKFKDIVKSVSDIVNRRYKKYILDAYDENLESKIRELEKITRLKLSNNAFIMCLNDKEMFDKSLEFLSEILKISNSIKEKNRYNE